MPAKPTTKRSTSGSRDELGLTHKQRRFVEEYLLDFDGGRAAKAAGYQGNSVKAGSHALALPRIQAALAKEIQARAARMEISADRVVLELARLALSDMRDYVEWGPDGVRLKASAELTDNQARAVIEVSETVTSAGTRTTKFKLSPKQQALDSLAKHFGMYIERHHVVSEHVTTIRLPEGFPGAADTIQAIEDLEASHVRALEHAGPPQVPEHVAERLGLELDGEDEEGTDAGGEPEGDAQ